MTDWSDIVRQYGPLVWKTAHRLLDNETDARDCFQEAFVSAWELSRRQSIRHWPAVLKRLATARALDRLRVRYRIVNRSEAWPDEQLVDDSAPDPTLRALEGEVADQLRIALSQIDQKQAEVFCLAVFDDLAYREIADHLGLTVNHVGVLLHRAKLNLQDLMTAYRPSTLSRSESQRSCKERS